MRWPDLIRWDLAEEAMAAHFALKDEGYNETSEQPTYAMKPYNKLAPIPLADILAYGNKDIMWQNDGY
ncbi:RagB/SusD family nutrient uptake outer membrane protein [Bacteroides sp. BFG-551]|nr:RagB/SusD family nutrient uptake outer membrane protein [Bacteroides sp. BFG-551]